MRQQPTLAATAALSLALGIGSATAIAQFRVVVVMILAQGARLLTIGLAIGAAGGYAVAIYLERLMPRAVHSHPASNTLALGVTAVLLILVGLLSTWLPARRAARIEPTQALRAE
jgi:ABC-type lipoprotein release transport system permease subunit